MKGNIYLELSSSSKAECRNTNEVFAKIISDKIDNIIMCTNSTRVQDIITIINDIYDDDFKNMMMNLNLISG